MAAEIELKLSLPNHYQQTLAEHPLVRQHQRGEPVQRALYNRYFDTPDQQLNAHAVALRIRRQGSNFIQTLKTRGISQAGLHQRQEWEWPLPADQLQTDLLPEGGLPADINVAALVPAFSTDFQRTTWLLDYRHQTSEAEIELVLDEGWVSAGDRRDPIREVEMELKAGDATAILAFAQALAGELPLRICRISKAERGYRLCDPERARQLPERPVIASHESHQHAFYTLADALTERLLCAMEGYEFLGDQALLLPLMDDLTALVTLLEGYSASHGQQLQINPLRQCEQALRTILAPLLIAREFGGDALLEQQRPMMEAELARWLNSIELAQALLRLSAELRQQPWQETAIDRGTFFANAPFFSNAP